MSPLRRLSSFHHRVTIVLLLLIIPLAASAKEFAADPSSYRSLLKLLQPGDTLRLSAGEYLRGLPLHHLQGVPDNPITITGPDGGPPALFLAQPGQNTVSIFNSSYITIRNLVLDGHGLPVDGVKAEGHADWAHHIILENLLIRGHGNNQQTVGISTKCPAWGWEIRGNVISGAGTGIYLGNSDGSDPFVAGLIEHNLIVDTIGYNLQIKHQNTRPKVPGLPEGRQQTIIRHNVFSKADGGSEGPVARPNVLVGHWPLKGLGVDDLYQIYGNFFYQNPHEALFQGEGNIALYNNLFVNRHGDAVHIQPHNDVPRAINIFYNTILSSGVGISIRNREGSQGFVQTVTANAVFSRLPIIGGLQNGNITGAYDDANNFLLNPFATLGEMDLYPKSDAMRDAVVNLGPSHGRMPDWDKDFNGHQRDGRFRGAYSGEGKNPGWSLQLERKPYL